MMVAPAVMAIVRQACVSARRRGRHWPRSRTACAAWRPRAARSSAKGALPTDARAEAADCLRVLCDGDEVLQAVLAEEGALPSAAVMLGAGGDVADAAARLLKSFAECFDEAIDEAKAKVKK